MVGISRSDVISIFPVFWQVWCLVIDSIGYEMFELHPVDVLILKEQT